MEFDLSRRSLLSGAVGASGALLAQIPPAQAQAPTAAPAPTPPPVHDSLTIDLLGQPEHFTIDGCWLKEANFRNFPASAGVSGGVISLAPGAVRELHWHAQASEWAYVISGRCRVSIIDTRGRSQTVDFGPGDTWYFPRGHGHAIQCLGDAACTFVLAFDSGVYSEYATFGLTDWMAGIPPQALAQAFDVTPEQAGGFGKPGTFFAKGVAPTAPPPSPKDALPDDAAVSCRYALREQPPTFTRDGVRIWIASSREFPISTSMAAALVELAPGKQRDPHWHPNANEWQYIVSGKARTTINIARGNAVSYEVATGSLVYVPRGCGHFTENIGAEPLELVAVFDDGTYSSVELKDWFRSNTAELLAANFHKNAGDIRPLLD